MTKEPYKLYVRVPVFGDGEIELYNESKIVYNKFRDEIDRLRKIPHLGILHYFSGIPKYSRYDHVMLMLLLIRQISNNKSTNISLKNELKIEDVKFSSIEEFLKSLAMLYPTGHLQMTFTSEHAFLRFLTKNNKTDEFIEAISKKVKNIYGDNSKFGNRIIENFKNIVETGSAYKLSKIFTAIKILEKIDNKDNEDFKKMLIILNIFILRNDYIESVAKTPGQSEKLKKTMDYFKTIRDLAFLILDGTISQHVLNLSPYSVTIHLDKFVSENPYKYLLKDIKKFYDDTIYMSDEGQYYHYRVSNIIENNVFEKEKPLDEIINEIIDNNYDNKIKSTIQKEIKEIDVDKSKGKIKEILKHHMKIMIPSSIWINNNIVDNKCFNGLKYHYGGISYYMASMDGKYRIDIYPKDCDEQSLSKYKNEIWEIASSLYGILNEDNRGVFKKHMHILLSDLYQIEFFNIFNPIAKYLASNYLSTNAEFSSHKIKSKIIFNQSVEFPILFKSEHVKYVINIMEKCRESLPKPKDGGNKGDINEMNQIIDILKDIDKRSNNFYILAPQVNLIRRNDEQTELDFLLIEYGSNDEVKSIKIYIGETKTNKKKINTKQLVDQIHYSFGINKDVANLVVSGKMNGSINIKSVRNDGNLRIYMKEITYSTDKHV